MSPWTVSAWSAFLMAFLPLFMGIRHLAHVLTVPPIKVRLLCVTPAGMDLYIQAMPVGTYRVQSPGFPKIVYSPPVFYTSFVDPNHYARQQQCLVTKVLGVHDIHWKFYFLHFSFACSSSCHNSLISLCLMEIKDLCWSENKLLKHVAILWQCVALFISHMVRTVYSIHLYRYGKNRESRNKYCMISWTPISMATVPEMAT